MSTLHTELSNLLPHSARRRLRREYFVRLATVGLGLGVLVIIAHGILLFPAYLYARAETKREQAELDAMTASASNGEEHDIAARIANVQEDIAYLGRLGAQPTASAALRSLVSVPHSGIALTGFTFTAPKIGEKDAQMTITGLAATRDSLRIYVESLGQLSYVSKADLPISAYAKESQIPFTITLTGSLMP